MKYLLIFLSSFIVFAANAEPAPKDVNVVNVPTVNVGNTVEVSGAVTVTIDGSTPIPVRLVGPNCSGGCGFQNPTIEYDGYYPPQPQVGDLVSLELLAADLDNYPPCFLDQLLKMQSEFVQMPPGSTTTLTPSVGNPAFIPDVPGNYTIRVTAIDDTGCSSSDDFTIAIPDTPPP